jgi:hypothetical protein
VPVTTISSSAVAFGAVGSSAAAAGSERCVAKTVAIAVLSNLL